MTTTTIGVRHTVVPPTALTDRYARALTYSAAIHSPHQHDNPSHSAMAHLLGASSVVLQCGGDEELAIAALLHDAVAACGGLPRVVDIRTRFGDRIADAVLGCGLVGDDEALAGATETQRYAARLQRLTDSHPDTLLVCLAVATDDARTLALRFGAPAAIVGHYEDCLRVGLHRGAPQRLTAALSLAVDGLLDSGNLDLG